MCNRLWGLVLTFVLGVAASSPAADKYALLIGVSKYDHATMNQPEPLKFPEADARALGDLLKQGGYEVDLLLGKQATQKTVRDKLAALAHQGSADGVVFVGLFGHGVEIESGRDNDKLITDGCFCPFDTTIRVVKDANGREIFGKDRKPLTEPDPASLVKLSELMTALTVAKAGHRVVVADCCRTIPNQARGRSFGAGFKQENLPENTSILFGCSPNEKAFEHPDWGHGAFTKCLLEAMTELSASGHVETGRLGGILKKRVPQLVATIAPRESQTPKLFVTDLVDLQIQMSPSGPRINLVASSPVIQRLLSKARNVADAIDHEDTKTRLLRMLTELYFDLGDGDNGLHTAQDSIASIKNNKLRVASLQGSMIRHWGQTGDYKSAVRTLSEMAFGGMQESDVEYLATQMANAQHTEEILNWVRSINDLEVRADYLRLLAIAFTKASSQAAARNILLEARGVVAKIADENERLEATIAIAHAFFDAGDSDTAKRLLSDVLRSAQSVADPDKRGRILTECGSLQIKLGDREGALHTAELVPQNSGWVNDGLRRVIANDLEKGRFDLAFSLVEAYRGQRLEAELLLTIARSQHEQGKPLDAIQTFRLAKQKALALPTTEQHQPLYDLTFALISASQLPDALEVGKAMGNGSVPLRYVAVAQAKKNSISIAEILSTCELIEDVNQRSYATAETMRARAELGDFEGAMQLLDRLPSAERSDSLIDILVSSVKGGFAQSPQVRGLIQPCYRHLQAKLKDDMVIQMNDRDFVRRVPVLGVDRSLEEFADTLPASRKRGEVYLNLARGIAEKLLGKELD